MSTTTRFILFLMLLSPLGVLGQVDQWYPINEGLGKCASIGQSGPTYAWYRDNGKQRGLTDRRGELYVWFEYSGGGTNPSTQVDGSTHPDFNYQTCSGGLFKRDTIRSKWVKVAEQPPTGPYNRGQLLSNHDEIFFAREGRIWQFTDDYANHPTGWELLSRAPFNPLTYDQMYQSNCPSCGNLNDPVALSRSPANTSAAYGDTLFFFILEPDNYNFNTVAKFSISDQSWSFFRIGQMPHQHYGINNGNTDDSDYDMVIADNISGVYRYFINYERFGSQYFVPSFYWVYDPTKTTSNKWVNISVGPRYVNFTGNSCSDPACQDCENGIGVCESIENGGDDVNAGWANGHLKTNWDGDVMYASTQSGIYEWRGSTWRWLADASRGMVDLATDQGVYTKGYYNRGPAVKIAFDGTFEILGANDGGPFSCKHNSATELVTPNNGRDVYIGIDAKMKNENICDWPNVYSADFGVWTIKPDPTKPKAISNLHLRTGTYLGGDDNGNTNEVVGTGYGQDYKLYVAGNFNGLDVQDPGQKPSPAADYTQLGAAATSANQEGKIVVYNAFADTMLAAITLGDVIYDYEIQNSGNYRMVVTGDFGAAVLDADLNVLWHKDLATVNTQLGDPFGVSTTPLQHPYPLCDIDDAGRVVLAMGRHFNHRWRVFEPGGAPRSANSHTFFTSIRNTGQQFVEDITIKNDTVYGGGFNNGTLPTNAEAVCGASIPYAVQSGWLRAWTYSAGSSDHDVDLWHTWGFMGDSLEDDQADTRVYRINVGKDGKVYVLGEAAGGNSVFRWKGKKTISTNGCVNPQESLVKTDLYNQPVNTKSAHLTYFCTVDPTTGVVERGQYIIPRLDDGVSNTFRIKEGYVHADEFGFVYIGGGSSYALAGRKNTTVNGQLLGPYAGDMSAMIVEPNYQYRTYWGAFGKNEASGTVNSIAVRDNYVSVAGPVSKGQMFTGAEKPLGLTGDNCDYEFKPDYAILQDGFQEGDDTQDDSYLAMWYQDVWNYADCDSIEYFDSTCTTCDTLTIPDSLYQREVDFSADVQTVCVGSGNYVTFTNESVYDSTGHLWDFGDGAQPANTVGEGPHAVYYNTPGSEDREAHGYAER